MPSLNEAKIIGHIGQQPEIRTMTSGKKVASFSVATSEKWTDKSTGEKKERTEWHRIVVFAEPHVKFIEQYANKGDLVYVTGSIETRKWTDNAGQDKYTTEIVIRPFGGEFKLLSGKKGQSQGQQNNSLDDNSQIPF